MKRYLFVFLLTLPLVLSSQENLRPKIGLTLSGGGARGLVHIGLLKAIDSVGLQVDYISGTSMGAIVGGLYAVGYSGVEIEAIAREMDWEEVVKSSPSYNLLVPYQRKRVGRYFEIPFVDGQLSLGKGLLESNDMMLLLNELFFSYLDVSNFDTLPIPFRCVATDFEDGSAKILDKGNIAKAIRASMSIPGVFTPTEIDDGIYIDGGIAMNFPVSVVKDMGADYVIGSSINTRLRNKDDLNSPIQALTQLIFYKENDNYQVQKQLVDLFIEYPIESYNTADFHLTEELLSIGNKKAEELIVQLSNLKDSLDLMYGKQPERELSNKGVKSYFVSNFSTVGLTYEEEKHILNTLNFFNNENYNSTSILEEIDLAYSSGKFSKINYEIIDKGKNDTVDICIEFEKKARTKFLAGLNYRDETGFAINLGLSSFGSFNLFTETLLEFSISDNPRFKFSNIYFPTKNGKWFLESTAFGSTIKMPSYGSDFVRDGRFRDNYLAFDVELNRLKTRKLTLGGGVRYEYLHKEASDEFQARIEGAASLLTPYLSTHFNNLQSSVYPNRGNQVDIEVGMNINLKSDYHINVDDGMKHSTDFDKKPYYSFRYYSAHYYPIGRHSTFLKINSGIYFDNSYPLINEYVIGGDNHFLSNQIVFPGFAANTITSSSVISSQLGFQYNINKSLVLSSLGSMVNYDFIKNSNFQNNANRNYKFGFAIKLGYKSILGPIEAMVMYNTANGKFRPVFNLGYAFQL